MDIPHPRRILILFPPDTPVSSLLQDLTGPSASPTDPTTSSQELTHQITTPYYTASVPVWTDTLVLPSWKTSWLSPDAGEVVRAIGAFVLVFRKPVADSDLEDIKSLLGAVNEVIEKGGGYTWDGVKLAVGLKQGVAPNLQLAEEEWEGICREDGGWEWVDGELEGSGRGEFGELTGIARLKEALETNDWEGGDNDELGLEGLDFGEADRDEGFDAEAAEVEREMFEMRRAIYEPGEGQEEEGIADEVEDSKVEELESMMLQMQAIRDMGLDMPEPERKKFAAKAVRDIMKKSI
ncbi:hypothetical protein MMC08_001467 [Hypocenomyce scalaris]|nr:hypothetical protein [Hypocenomyce scalaris]